MDKIKVISIGGCGVNIINTITEKVEKDVITISISPNYSDNHFSKADIKLVIGDEITNGLSCSGNVDIGKKVVYENEQKINILLEDTDYLFLTAGLGGGTGTGMTPVIATKAMTKNIFTIGIVTFPFYFEGEKRKKVARKGIKELKNNVNVLVIIKQDNLVKTDSMLENFKNINIFVGQLIVDMLKLIKLDGKIDKWNSLDICNKYNIEMLFKD